LKERNSNSEPGIQILNLGSDNSLVDPAACKSDQMKRVPCKGWNNGIDQGVLAGPPPERAAAATPSYFG
jgi:hypothetical protein